MEAQITIQTKRFRWRWSRWYEIFSTAPGSNHPINNSGASPNTAITVTATSFPVTIGGGGSGAGSGNPDSGFKGVASVFSTVTSAGGGGGGGHDVMGCMAWWIRCWWKKCSLWWSRKYSSS